MIETKEEWKDVPRFEGLYEASRNGEIKSKKRYGTPGGILKQYVDRKGYLKVVLYKNNIPHYMTVHQIVAQTFIPNPENKETVNHINNIKTDNRVENLEWCTIKENLMHSHKQHRQRINAVPILAINKKTGKQKRFFSQHEAARQLHVCQTDISKIIRKAIERTSIKDWEFYKDE